MELHSRDISPFAARVRVSILAKSLPIRVLDDPDVGSEAFGALNPLRRVPVLVLDDGTAIPESETIVEYLEETHPEPALQPADPVARARVRLVSRVAELYVFAAVLPIFAAFATRDPQQIETGFAGLDSALGKLSPFLDARTRSWHCFGDRLTTADGALAPFLFYVDMLGRRCGRAPLAKHARLERFWDGARSQPVLATVIGQIGRAMAAAEAGARA